MDRTRISLPTTSISEVDKTSRIAFMSERRARKATIVLLSLQKHTVLRREIGGLTDSAVGVALRIC